MEGQYLTFHLDVLAEGVVACSSSRGGQTNIHGHANTRWLTFS